MVPSKPVRKSAPGSTNMGFAKGGMAPRPQRVPASADHGKGSYVRQSSGLNPDSVPRKKIPEGSAISSGVQPHNNPGGQNMSKKLKGGAD